MSEGKGLRATLLTGSVTMVTLGVTVISGSVAAGNMDSAVIGIGIIAVGAILAYIREIVKEDSTV